MFKLHTARSSVDQRYLWHRLRVRQPRHIIRPIYTVLYRGIHFNVECSITTSRQSISTPSSPNGVPTHTNSFAHTHTHTHTHTHMRARACVPFINLVALPRYSGANATFDRCLFLNNGDHFGRQSGGQAHKWSDGLTINSGPGAVVVGCLFQDNSDINFIIAEAHNARIKGNTVRHCDICVYIRVCCRVVLDFHAHIRKRMLVLLRTHTRVHVHTHTLTRARAHS